MTIRFLPFLIAAALLGAVIYFFASTGSSKTTFGAPLITRIGDFDGTESEVAIAPDGKQYAAIVSGNVWLMNIADGSKRQVEADPEPQSYPSWAPDSRELTFTRGNDTYRVDASNAQSQATLFKANATSLNWAPSGRLAFVRDRELWLANANGSGEVRMVPADPDGGVMIHSPRFSPNSLRLSYIKSLRNLRGEVWVADVLTQEKRLLIGDRISENPMDTGWIMDGKKLVYLTDRSGAYALWTVDFEENTILTLTTTLDLKPLQRIGMSVWKDRIVLPRHFLHSDIALSDGSPVVRSDDLKLEPAVSPDGSQLAYTVQSDNKFTVWTCGIHGENAVQRVDGHYPRFAPSGYQIVFTRTDLDGNSDIWMLDLRTNETERVTDADEIDTQPDWQPKGKSIVFASNHGGPMSVWSVPAIGGRRVPLNNGGFYPRYSADGQFIVYWSKMAFWQMNVNGSEPRMLREGPPEPAPAVVTKKIVADYRDKDVNGGKPIWPEFDVLPDGRYVVAPIDARETSLWAVDLTFVTK